MSKIKALAKTTFSHKLNQVEKGEELSLTKKQFDTYDRLGWVERAEETEETKAPSKAASKGAK